MPVPLSQAPGAVSDRRLTRFCTARLRIENGDVFMVVGTVRPEKLLPFVERQRELFDVSGVMLEAVLAPAGHGLETSP